MVDVKKKIKHEMSALLGGSSGRSEDSSTTLKPSAASPPSAPEAGLDNGAAGA